MESSDTSSLGSLFVRQWMSGRKVPVELWLQQAGLVCSDESELIDLVYCEWMLRQDEGERPSQSEFLRRFPQVSDALRRQFLVLDGVGTSSVWRKSSTLGSSVVLDEYSAEITNASLDSLPLTADDIVLNEAVEGRFQLIRELGDGAMGRVFLALDRNWNETIALKMLHRRRLSSISQLKNEFRSLSEFRHPNLVAMRDLFLNGADGFLTMEYVDGVDFLTHINEANDDEERDRRLRASIEQLAIGLQFLHERGKIHRDIKPSNVLVSSQGRVVVLDFGLITSWTADQNAISKFAGTPAYMSPEQLACEPVGPPSDWYSVGIMIAEALTGRRPNLAEAHSIADDITPLVPKQWQELVLGLLEDTPADRWTGTALRHFLSPISSTQRQSNLDFASEHEAPFVGREEKLKTLEASFASVVSGSCQSVWIAGDSGIGKSALLRHFLTALQVRNNVVVLRGRCHEHETIPFKALDAVVEQLATRLCLEPQLLPAVDSEAESESREGLTPVQTRALLRLFPVLRRVPQLRNLVPLKSGPSEPAADRLRGLAAIVRLFKMVGDHRPIVVAIDDIQWGDRDSAFAIAEILAAANPPRLLLLATGRPELIDRSEFASTVSERIETLGLTNSFRKIDLEPLTYDESAVLARQVLDGTTLAEKELDQFLGEASGHPYLLCELLQGWKRSGPAATPGSLDDILWARVQSHRNAAVELMCLASVASRPLSLRIVQSALDTNDFLGTLGELKSERLVRLHGIQPTDLVEPYHDRVRESISARLTGEQRRHYHQKIVDGLRGAAVDEPDLLALHSLGAGDHAEAGRASVLAGERALQLFAFDRAAEFYRMALQLRQDAGLSESELRIKLGDAVAGQGLGPEAAREYFSAANAVPLQEGRVLRGRAIGQLVQSGHTAEGLAQLRTLLEEAGAHLPRSQREAQRRIIWLMFRLWWQGYHRGWRERPDGPIAEKQLLECYWDCATGLINIDILGFWLATYYSLYAMRGNDVGQIARALALTATQLQYWFNLGSYCFVERLREESLAMLDSIPDAYSRGYVLFCQGAGRLYRGEFAAALESLHAAREQLTRCERPTLHVQAQLSMYVQEAYYYLGDFAALKTHTRAATDDAADRGDIFGMTLPMLWHFTTSWLKDDEADEASQTIDRRLKQFPEAWATVRWSIELGSRVDIAIYRRHGAKAWREVESRWDQAVSNGVPSNALVYGGLLDFRGRAALAALTQDAHSRVLHEEVRRTAKKLRRLKTPYAQASAGMLHGALASVEGDVQSSIGYFRQTHHQARSNGIKLYEMIAGLRLGQLVGGEQGEALLADSQDWLEKQEIRNPDAFAFLFSPMNL